MNRLTVYFTFVFICHIAVSVIADDSHAQSLRNKRGNRNAVVNQKQVATLIFSMGGTAKVVVGNASFEVAKIDDLPRQKFDIVTVFLDASSVEDDDLIEIVKLPKLKGVQLSRTAITDEGVKLLCSSCPSLETIHLSETEVTDQGVRHLTNLPRLTYLFLRGNQIGDQGALTISRIRRLRELNIERTDVTSEGLTVLQKFLPGCKITY